MWIGFNESLTGNQQKNEGSRHRKMQPMLCFVAPPRVSVDPFPDGHLQRTLAFPWYLNISDDCSHKSLELEEEQNKEVKNI